MADFIRWTLKSFVDLIAARLIKQVPSMKQMNLLQKFFDKMLWLFGPGAAICLAVAGYQTFHFVAWPEVEAQVRSIEFTCMAIKKNWWQKHGTRSYYSCDDSFKSQQLTAQGFVGRGARTLSIAVEFKTLEGTLVSTTISNLEQDLSNKDRSGMTQIRYSRFDPHDAQFNDVTSSMMRDFWIMGALGVVLAYLCRKAIKALADT